MNTELRANEPTSLANRAIGVPFAERTGRVLCLGNDDRVMLAVVRSLGRRGLEVHTGWCDRSLPANRSRYVRRHLELPPFQIDDDTWMEALNERVHQTAYDLVIPVNDYAVLPLQLHRRRLSPTTRWYLLEDDVFQIVSDKRRTVELARACGVPVPVELRIRPADVELNQALAKSIDGFEFPAYIKPTSSIHANDVANKRAVQRVDNRLEMTRALQEFSRDETLLIQPEFVGVGQGVEVLAWQGRVLVQMQHRRIRETIDGGSTCREVVRPNPQLAAAAGRMIAALRYTGVAMVEFRIDPETGNFVLLEINGRFWGSLPLAVAAGVPFPWYLYRLLVCGQTRFPAIQPRMIQCRNLLPDLRQLKRQSGAARAVASLVAGPLSGVREDHWATDDVAPYLALWRDVACCGLRKMGLGRRRHRMSG